MIGKKIRNPKKSASKGVRISKLLDYIREEKKEGKDKNIYEGSRNFLTENKKQEMQDLAYAAPRSKDPINHYVFSWKEGEKPSPKQIERAVDIVLSELQMKDHQAVYALHANTKHSHLHLVINRVHPETYKVNKARNDYEAVDRAIARIIKEQNWEKKKGERFLVNETGELERILKPATPPEPSPEKRDREIRKGQKSAERIAIETAPKLLQLAKNWREVHNQLAEKGLRLERKGSGAILWVGDIPVKASQLGKEFSFGNLQKRLGAFEPAPAHLEVKPLPEQKWLFPNKVQKDNFKEQTKEHTIRHLLKESSEQER